jgi:IclR helix-turn-helix domain
VDLVLGQGMLAAGWHAHTLNAPGKFLVSAPEHTTPKRARAYLVTDDDVSRTVAYYGPHRPQLDNVSRAALNLGPAVAEPVPWYLIDRSRDAQSDPDEPGGTPDGYDTTTLEGAVWVALCSAPEDGSDIAELMRTTGMGRSTVYRYLAQLAEDGRAVQVGVALGRQPGPDVQELRDARLGGQVADGPAQELAVLQRHQLDFGRCLADLQGRCRSTAKWSLPPSQKSYIRAVDGTVVLSGSPDAYEAAGFRHCVCR